MKISEKIFTNKKEARKLITQLKREVNQLMKDTFYLIINNFQDQLINEIEIEKEMQNHLKKSPKINQKICVNCQYYPKLEKAKKKAELIKLHWINCREIKILLQNTPCNGCWTHIEHENFKKKIKKI